MIKFADYGVYEARAVVEPCVRGGNLSVGATGTLPVRPDAEDPPDMMHLKNHNLRCWLALLITICTLSNSVGCYRIYRNRNLEASLPPVPMETKVPTEEHKITLPPYVIEPPDVLLISALKVVPKSPYHLEHLDVLDIRVDGAFPDKPIDGVHQVESSGEVNLGLDYGKVSVVGLTIEEAKKRIQDHLGQVLQTPDVTVTLQQTSGTQEIGGEHLVNQDGTVNLGTYGQVYVTGMTLHDAKMAIEDHLSEFLDDPRVSVDVFGYNSKVYYVITNGAGGGDQLQRFPIVGGETVLDAISELGGLSGSSTENMWIARPAPDKAGIDVILPIDWVAVSSDASPATNYQLLPGDRIYIDGNKLVLADTVVGRLTAPFQRVVGFLNIGASTIRSLKIGFGNRGNNNR